MRKRHNVRNVRRTASEMWSKEELYTDAAYQKLVISFCKETNTPFSLMLLIFVRTSDWLSALAVCSTLNPLHYGEDYITYSMNAQCVALVKKYKGLNTGIDTGSACAKKFVEAELSCRKTNEYFRSGDFFKVNNNNALFHRAKSIVADILGDPDLLDLTQVSFSTGRTFSIKQNVSVFDKLKGPLEVTKGAEELAKDLLMANPGWYAAFSECDLPSRDELAIVTSPGDLYSSVPKDATTDRPLGIPPLLNAVLCKGVGKHISRRYRKVTGININTAQRLHARIVERASVDGMISSVDLVSASDTIAAMLTLELLPYGWFTILNKLRSPMFFLKENKTWYEYEKFTAMGCAFTFELESVIFYSLCKAAMDINGISGTLSVYGDDILLPTAAYDVATAFLGECGFETNMTKSFSTGYFRESCGADFLNGHTVRPFYLKDKLSPRVLTLFHNTLVRQGTRYRFPKSFCLLRKMIPGCLYDTISSSFKENGDDYLIDESIVEGLATRTMQVVMRTRRVSIDDPDLLPYFLYRIETHNHKPLVNMMKDVLDATEPLRIVINKDTGKEEYELPNFDATDTTSYSGENRNKRPTSGHYYRVSSLKQDLQQ